MSDTDTKIREHIKSEISSLVEIRHDLHKHPELMFKEKRTCEVVQRELSKLGIEFVTGLAGGTGTVAHFPATGSSDNTIALRADMDALPIKEDTGEEYASVNDGVMHACGHDGHTTILLGVARILAKINNRPRPITLIFQPAEEGGGGGRKMVEEGVLDGSVIGKPVREIYALHGWPNIPLGVVATRPGPLLAATDEFTITIKGKGCHAAFPHLGHDPVVTAASVINILQTLVSRADPTDSVVISITSIAGGDSYNVIPSEVVLCGTVRTLLPVTRETTKEQFFKVVGGISVAMGCRAEIEWKEGYPVTYNNPAVTGRFLRIAEETAGKDRTLTVEKPVMGGEDFSYYCQHVPACFFLLGMLPPGADPKTAPQLHQSTFNFNDDAIPLGVELMLKLALRES